MFAKKIGFGNSDKSMQTWFLKKKSLSKNDSYFSSSFKYCQIGDKKGYTMFDGCQLRVVGGGNSCVVLVFNNEPNNTILLQHVALNAFLRTRNINCLFLFLD